MTSAPPTTSAELSLADVRAARERISSQLVATPCPESFAFGDLIPGRLFVKLENLHRTGSFKERGALNKMLQLSAEQRARGVVTASAGNHAQGVAFHAHRLGIAATVVMPENTPHNKVKSTERYHAKVVLRGNIYDDAAVEARRLELEQGLVMIHPFDDLDVRAG